MLLGESLLQSIVTTIGPDDRASDQLRGRVRWKEKGDRYHDRLSEPPDRARVSEHSLQRTRDRGEGVEGPTGADPSAQTGNNMLYLHDVALPRHILAVAQEELEPGELIAWAARPETDIVLDREPESRWHAAAILGGGYATVSALALGWWSQQALWILLPAAWLLVCWVGMNRRARARARRKLVLDNTLYVVTTKRAMFVEAEPETRMRILPLELLADLQLARESTLDGGQEHWADLEFDREPDGSSECFLAIYKPKRAHQLLTSLVRDPEAVNAQLLHEAQYAQFLTAFRDGN